MQKQALEDKALAKELIREKKEKQLRKEAYEKQAMEGTLLKRKEQEQVINQLAQSADIKVVVSRGISFHSSIFWQARLHPRKSLLDSKRLILYKCRYSFDAWI